MTGKVGGWSEEGFGPVVDEFERVLARDWRTAGGALSVWHMGKPVIEVFGGTADCRSGRPWDEGTLSVIFSATKGLGALAVGMLLERGKISSLDVPLAEFWPEFAAHGKGAITIGDALAHRAGVSAPRRDMTFEEITDGSSLAHELAAQEPLWEPGEYHHYHAWTIGTIFEEVVRRVSGVRVTDFLEAEVIRPLRSELWLGLPPSEDERLAHLVWSEEPAQFANESQKAAEEAIFWHERAMTVGGAIDPKDLVRPEVLRHAFMGTSGVATASGLARIWSASVAETAGVRLFSTETAEALRQLRSAGAGRFPVGPPPYQSWGAGVMVRSDWSPYLSPRSLGHDGAGGQIAFADQAARVGFTFLTNRMGRFDKGQPIVDALAAVLGVA